MTDPTRLVDSGDPSVRRLLESASADRPDSTAAKATLVALGLTAPALAAAAAPGTTVAAAAAKGTLAAVLGTVTAKVAIAVTAAAVASTLVLAVAKHRPAPAPAPVASTLAEESALLRTAADALAAAQPGQALNALQQHDARFPRGLLSEEAAALKVEALDAAGDRAGARAALDRFHARYPESPFAPVIKSAPPGDESPQAEQGDSQ